MAWRNCSTRFCFLGGICNRLSVEDAAHGGVRPRSAFLRGLNPAPSLTNTAIQFVLNQILKKLIDPLAPNAIRKVLQVELGTITLANEVTFKRLEAIAHADVDITTTTCVDGKSSSKKETLSLDIPLVDLNLTLVDNSTAGISVIDNPSGLNHALNKFKDLLKQKLPKLPQLILDEIKKRNKDVKVNPLPK